MGEGDLLSHRARQTATKVENYRHRHAITDLGSAFCAEPPGVERHGWARACDEAIAAIEPPAKSRGLRIQ